MPDPIGIDAVYMLSIYLIVAGLCGTMMLLFTLKCKEHLDERHDREVREGKTP